MKQVFSFLVLSKRDLGSKANVGRSSSSKAFKDIDPFFGYKIEEDFCFGVFFCLVVWFFSFFGNGQKII